MFFGEDDAVYLSLLAEGCAHASVDIRAYCLMPNRVRPFLVPVTADGLRAAIWTIGGNYV